MTKDEWSTQLNKWHYLGSRCQGIMFAWGHDEGCCIYGLPRSRMIYRWFPGLTLWELIRMVGKPGHQWSMTSLMSQAHRELKKLSVDVIVTYADPVAGHSGSVYKAGNWTPIGTSSIERVWTLDGIRVSRKSFYSKHGTQSESAMKKIYGDRLSITEGKPKPRFLLGLSKAGKRAVDKWLST